MNVERAPCLRSRFLTRSKRVRLVLADAVLMGADPFFSSRRVQLATLAAHHLVPLIGASGDYAEAGALISYGG